MKELGNPTPELVEVPFLPEKFDAVIALGKNLGLGWTAEEIREQRFHLSNHSRITVLAAGILYKEGLVDTIVFSTGKTAGKDIPSEASLMKEQLHRIFPSIPSENVLLEETSWDTNTNAKVVKKLAKGKGFKKLALLTVDFHLNRSLYLFERAGINPEELLASDDVAADIFPKFVANYQASDLYIGEIGREMKGLKIQKLPLAPEALSVLTGIKERKVGLRRLVNGLTPLTIY